MTSATCSRKPCRFSNSFSALTSSLRLSRRPAASGDFSARHIVGVAALLEDGLGELDVADAAVADRGVPAVEAGDELAERDAGAGRQAAVGDEQRGAFEERDAGGAGGAVDLLQRLVAEAALRDVDDALEGEVVVGRDGDAEVGHRVADLLALVEARAADDAVGQADGQEAVLEGAHLVARRGPGWRCRRG